MHGGLESEKKRVGAFGALGKQPRIPFPSTTCHKYASDGPEVTKHLR